MRIQDFGNYISTRRKELGLSQKDLADFLSVSIPTISKYENGLLYPDLSLIGSLAKILKVDLISLVNYESKLNNNYDIENEFDINSFSNYFKSLRKMNNYTLNSLADKLDTRYQTISKWETNESLPSIEQLIKCSELFNVPLYELYYGKKLDIKKEVIIKEKESKFNKSSLILSFISIVVLLISLVTIIFDKDDNNLSTSNEFTNKVIVKYEFDSMLDSISFIIDKGSVVEKYDPHIEGYTVDYYLEDKLFDFNTKIYESITLTGVFKINTYIVSFFDLDNNIINTQNIEHGKSAEAPTITIEDESLKFLKWSEDYTCVKSNLDIYPVLINNEADITFNPNGGECDIKYIYDYDSSMFESLPKATKTGYKFIGWYLEDKLFTKDYEVGNPIVLIARYTPIEYKITLNSNGGNLDNTIINVLFDSDVTLPIPIKESEAFEGWYLNDELVNINFKYTYPYNIELIAKYSVVANKYTYSEFDNYIELLSYNGDESDVVIPSSINGKPVTTILNKIFEFNKDNIKSIRIPSSLITYNDGIFKDLPNLEKMYVPDYAQYNLNKFFDGEYPLNFYEIEFYGSDFFFINKNMFKNVNHQFKFIFNGNYKGIDISYDATYIKEIYIYSTYDNFSTQLTRLSNLEKLVIEGEMTSFNYCNYASSLKEVILPDSIRSISYDAFRNCFSLEYIDLPESLVDISECAFFDVGLKKIDIYNNVNYIYMDAFDGCNIEEVYFHGTLEEWKNIEFETFASDPLHLGGKLYINNELVEDPSVYPDI